VERHRGEPLPRPVPREDLGERALVSAACRSACAATAGRRHSSERRRLRWILTTARAYRPTSGDWQRAYSVRMAPGAARPATGRGGFPHRGPRGRRVLPGRRVLVVGGGIAPSSASRWSPRPAPMSSCSAARQSIGSRAARGCTRPPWALGRTLHAPEDGSAGLSWIVAAPDMAGGFPKASARR
jgi:hypothetical protein